MDRLNSEVNDSETLRLVLRWVAAQESGPNVMDVGAAGTCMQGEEHEAY